MGTYDQYFWTEWLISPESFLYTSNPSCRYLSCLLFTRTVFHKNPFVICHLPSNPQWGTSIVTDYNNFSVTHLLSHTAFQILLYREFAPLFQGMYIHMCRNKLALVLLLGFLNVEEFRARSVVILRYTLGIYNLTAIDSDSSFYCWISHSSHRHLKRTFLIIKQTDFHSDTQGKIGNLTLNFPSH